MVRVVSSPLCRLLLCVPSFILPFNHSLRSVPLSPAKHRLHGRHGGHGEHALRLHAHLHHHPSPSTCQPIWQAVEQADERDQPARPVVERRLSCWLFGHPFSTPILVCTPHRVPVKLWHLMSAARQCLTHCGTCKEKKIAALCMYSVSLCVILLGTSWIYHSD